MHAFAIFAVNEHIAELQAEAHRRRQARTDQPGTIRRILAAVSAALRTQGSATPTFATSER